MKLIHLGFLAWKADDWKTLLNNYDTLTLCSIGVFSDTKPEFGKRP